MTIRSTTNFLELYSRAQQETFGDLRKTDDSITYQDIEGFHLYSELSLTNDLTNPIDKASAECLFEVIQHYTDLATCCLSGTSGKILEVQGERLHIFFPELISAKTVCGIITFCAAFTTAVYNHKDKLGKTAFNGFKICFDYGRSIILRTGIASDDSIISLGSCANEPAKYLPEAKAGYTVLPTRIASLLLKDVDKRKNWYEINLYDRKSLPIKLEQQKYESILKSVADFNPFYKAGRFVLETSMPAMQGLRDLQHGFFVKGLFLRADLDGFTLRVKKAFENGFVRELVRDFSMVLKYGEDFIHRTETERPSIRIPWAGDCANILLLPSKKEKIKDMKYYYPATGAYDWLSRYDGTLSEPFVGAAWVVSICGGNTKTGDCQVLVAPIEANGHKFLFAAGWGVGRSLDAQNQEGTRANDAITSKEDYDDLDSCYKQQYSMLNTVFAHAISLKTSKPHPQSEIPSFVPKPHQVSEKTADLVPQPRPYMK